MTGGRDLTGGRLALSKPEAAEALGVSVDTLERHVLGELRVVRRGRLVLVPVASLRRGSSATPPARLRRPRDRGLPNRDAL